MVLTLLGGDVRPAATDATVVPPSVYAPGVSVSLGGCATGLVSGEREAKIDASAPPVLHDGALLVSARGLGTIVAGDWTVSALDGAFFLTQSPQSLTVAALSAPVLVSDGDARVLIPVGSQWRAAALSPLTDGIAPWKSTQDMKVLPADFIRKEIAKAPVIAGFCGTTSEASVEDRWLLGSVHPEERETVWKQSSPDRTTREAQLLRLFSFPLSDTLSDAASAPVVKRWQAAAEETLRRETEAPLIVELLLQDARDLLERFRSEDYPDRLQRYAEAFVALSEPYTDAFSPDTLALRQEITALQRGEDVAAVPSVAFSSEQSSSVPSWSAEEISSITHERLGAAGALFTVQTSITPTGSHSAAVSGIVFVDSFYSFTYDLATGEVSGIVKDGEQFPYALSLQKFAGWARGVRE
jgi:hypothetical protein